MPRINTSTPRGRTEAAEAPTEGFADLTLPPTGDIGGVEARVGRSFNSDVIEKVGDMTNIADKAAMLAFYEEMLDVVILDDSSENPENFVFLAVNGRGPMPGGSPWCPRNIPIRMARKYVEGLARSKPVNVATVEANDYDGYKTTRIRRTSSLRYPFTVLRDDNPRGAAWLREVLRQK